MRVGQLLVGAHALELRSGVRQIAVDADGGLHEAPEFEDGAGEGSATQARRQGLLALQQRAEIMAQTKLGPEGKVVIEQVILPSIHEQIEKGILAEFSTTQAFYRQAVLDLRHAGSTAAEAQGQAVEADSAVDVCQKTHQETIQLVETCEQDKQKRVDELLASCRHHEAVASLACEQRDNATIIHFADVCAPQHCDLRDSTSCFLDDYAASVQGLVADAAAHHRSYLQKASDCIEAESNATLICLEGQELVAQDVCSSSRHAAQMQSQRCSDQHEEASLAICEFGSKLQHSCNGLAAVKELQAKIKAANRTDSFSEPDRQQEWAAVQRLLCVLRNLRDDRSLERNVTDACAAEHPYPKTFDYMEETLENIEPADGVDCAAKTVAFSGYRWETGETSASFQRKTHAYRVAVNPDLPPFTMCGRSHGCAKWSAAAKDATVEDHTTVVVPPGCEWCGARGDRALCAGRSKEQFQIHVVEGASFRVGVATKEWNFVGADNIAMVASDGESWTAGAALAADSKWTGAWGEEVVGEGVTVTVDCEKKTMEFRVVQKHIVTLRYPEQWTAVYPAVASGDGGTYELRDLSCAPPPPPPTEVGCAAANLGQLGWQLVRHVPAGKTWHPAKDKLIGTETYGVVTGPQGPAAFSVSWVDTSYDQFLFATGDCEKWLLATKESVLGWYSNEARQILASSSSDSPYKAKWYRRSTVSTDPWIAIQDYSPAVAAGDIIYGENSYGRAQAENVLPVHHGANVFIRLSPEGLANKQWCEEQQSGWTLVRHVPGGLTWHPATDVLRGSEVYGSVSGPQGHAPWSIRFDTMDYDQFMFSTGDCQKWLIANKTSVFGEYSNSPRTIESSSISERPYQARWYRRASSKHDPWISMEDYSYSATHGGIMYGGNNFGREHAADILPVHNGANVWVRLSEQGRRAQRKCEELRSGKDGWVWVRHVPAGLAWHPATDNLVGSAVYGNKTNNTASKAWSIRYDNMNYDEFMFATGDCQKWLRAKKDQVFGYYSNSPRRVEESSIRSEPYEAKWYRRTTSEHDPWITLEDYSTSVAKGYVIYGGNSFGREHAANVVAVNNGADVYVRMSPEGRAQQEACQKAHEGWDLVRHVPPGLSWHPATDNLVGTAMYGTPSGEYGDEPWTIRYNSMDYDEFMFSTGDCLKWLVAEKAQVFGEYSNAEREILKSSISDKPYKARWYRRAASKHDPWISLEDYSKSVAKGYIMYGGNGFQREHALNVVAVNNGANVWIRLSDGGKKAKERCEKAKQGEDGWQLVRHVPAGPSWHPATDLLFGSEVYGKESHDEAAPAWSVKFMDRNYDQFMFATGDCQKWLMADKHSVLGWYSNAPRDVLQSSISDQPYQAKWYRRDSSKHDPWISVMDYSNSVASGNILYGGNAFEREHAGHVVAVHNGADVYIRMSPAGAAAKNQCEEMQKGWTLVRHVPAGFKWHPATDNLVGSEAYGDPSDDTKAWSVRYDGQDYNDFMFSTGDCLKWLVTKKDSLLTWYSNAPRRIEKSSLSDSGYDARWYRRTTSKHDPWVSLRDYSESVNQGYIMYGGNGFEREHANTILPVNNGANVWIRLTEDGAEQRAPCLAARAQEDGWEVVRRVGPGPTWHPATDIMVGTDQYGTAAGPNSTKPWTIPFNTKNFDEVMFASGDCQKWLVTTKLNLFEWYSNGIRRIERSSLSDKPYDARWYRRATSKHDPWISLKDYSDSVNQGYIMYGGNSFEREHAYNILPINNGASVFVRQSAESADVQGPCRDARKGEDGWQLVRRVKAGTTWHPAKDKLAGTEEYGTVGDAESSQTFTVKFADADFTEFMFATGDCSKWLIATKESVWEWYSNEQRQIESSSISSQPYKARWYRRSTSDHDPWISIKDYSESVATGGILYGGNSFGREHAANVLPAYNGANVFIRR